MQHATEYIEIALDDRDRIVRYALDGDSCACGASRSSGAPDPFQGRTAAEILAIDPNAPEACSEQRLKSIQAVLRVLLGLEDCGPDAPCAAATIVHDSGEVIMRALLRRENNTACHAASRLSPPCRKRNSDDPAPCTLQSPRFF